MDKNVVLFVAKLRSVSAAFLHHLQKNRNLTETTTHRYYPLRAIGLSKPKTSQLHLPENKRQMQRNSSIQSARYEFYRR